METILLCQRGWLRTRFMRFDNLKTDIHKRIAELRYFYKIMFKKSSGFRRFKAGIGHFECISCQFCACRMTILLPFSPREGLPTLSEHKISRVSDSRFRAKKRSATTRKAPTRSQRARRQVATTAPLQCNKGPVAEPGRRRGKPGPIPSKIAGDLHNRKRLYNNLLQKQ